MPWMYDILRSNGHLHVVESIIERQKHLSQMSLLANVVNRFIICKQPLQGPGKINKEDVNRLLARCTHVEAALNTIGASAHNNGTPASRSETPTAASSCQMQLTTYALLIPQL